MANIYDRLQATATRLLDKYAQGTVRHWRAGANTGSNFNPTYQSPTYTNIDAIVKGVSQKYINQSTIIATDLEVTASVFGLTPTLADKLELGGELKEIVHIEAIPANGTVCAWKFIVKS